MNLSRQSIQRGVQTIIKERVDVAVKEETEKAVQAIKSRIAQIVTETAVQATLFHENHTMTDRLQISLYIGDTKVDL